MAERAAIWGLRRRPQGQGGPTLNRDNDTPRHAAIGRHAHVVYSPETPLRHPLELAKQILVDTWRGRQLAWILFQRDLKAQFRQSYLGYFWLFITPLMTTFVWLFLNAQGIARVRTDVPYPVFVLTGMVVWTGFVASLLSPLEAFRAGLPVFTKLNVPFEAFIAASIAQAVFKFGLGSLLLIPVLWYYGVHPAATAWLYPVAGLLVMTMGLGIGLVLTPLGALYEDVGKGVAAAASILMYSVPVVYPISAGSGILADVLRNNPLTPAIALSRDALLTGSLVWLMPAMQWWALCLAEIVLALIALRVAKPHMIVRMGM